VLADLAVHEPAAFAQLVSVAGGKAVAPELVQYSAKQAVAEAEELAETPALPAAGETTADEETSEAETVEAGA
jgi:hypothetical protein